ncbi:phosphoglucomutase/phosphomannomutase family protein [Clostridium sp. CF012]|uniref:phosphoglucomutase/phosphomannomutase family protein n=1 Tax=Clostridium sp. CF012 TaxID=2843319 RepID=UPI001C0DE4B8|nr:phosphoglucomutase/phosphomannomutase family protein [Clostridium sp. CF012]MBU3144828.1 phosphoglucomutase/phosphomannomutase family protein [Clostridium sp. CF012]
MIKFGTGGWRAFIGEDFTKENVQILSQALATLMKNQKCDGSGFVVGYDNRFLSDKAAKWVSEVMAGNGIKVSFVEKSAPTPLIMFTVNSLDAYYGAAITASHNPADYNGLKIFTRGGRDASEDVTRNLEEIINNITIEDVVLLSFDSGIAEGLIEIIDPFNEFIDSIISMIDIESIKNSKLKVVLDPMFGVSKTCLQTILLTARCEVEIINNRHDTLFGGRLPSPSTHTLHRLKDLVVEKGYDIGIGTDGDADRLGIIDEKGNFIHPNDILSVLYYYLLKYKGWKGGVVRNLATTHLLDKIAAGFGEQCYEVPVGFKNISSKMEEKNALIGGESSGGLTIRGHIKGKDGIFAASLLIELLSVTGKSLSELLEEIHKQYGYFYMTESDYKFSIEVKDQLMTKLFVDKLIPNFGYEVEKTSYEDGVKVYFKNGGWIIARFSGTEPLLRIFSEMENEARASEISNTMKEFLNL